MSSILEYKGYCGNIEYSECDSIFYGKVQGIRSLISYEGESAKELVADFRNAIDDYLALCDEKGISPERAYKGTFNIRVSPELHKEAALYAHEMRRSLNSVVETALEYYIHDQKEFLRAFEAYKSDPVTYSLDEVEKELKLK